jgi:hypothetical protein
MRKKVKSPRLGQFFYAAVAMKYLGATARFLAALSSLGFLDGQRATGMQGCAPFLLTPR